MGSRQIVLVSTAGFSVLNTGIFWWEAKTKRLFSQCTLKGGDQVVTRDGTYYVGSCSRNGGSHTGGGVRTSPLTADRSGGRCSSGQATPAAQRGSVPQLLIFYCAAEIDQPRFTA
jgi:hypothetical protein